MNNYSAESTTEDTLAFLKKLLTKAREHLNAKEVEQQDLFNVAKAHVGELTQNDDRLFELTGVVIYDCSNYDHWETLSWFAKLFTPPPPDDRKTWYKEQVKAVVEDTRSNINATLDVLKTLEDFYNSVDRIIMHNTMSSYGRSLFQGGHELTHIIIGGKLPENMREQYDNLVAFSNNIDAINKMYESCTVHEFQTVSIEERMLGTIDLVQKYLVK